MKKFSFVLMAAAVLVAALSCEKENPIENNNPENVNVKTASWSFTANVENPVTKMGDMDSEGNFAWESGDEIKILYAGGSTTATATLEGGIATFEPSIPGGVTDVWMVYPSSMTASLDGDKLVIGMPGMQKDALSGWFVAKAAVGDASISFMHPVCYFKLIVDGDGNDVTDLELTSAGADITATSLSLAFDASGIPSATAVSGSAILSATFSGAGTYYIPVLPDVDFASGDLKFQFYRGGSNAEKAGAYKHNAAVTSTRAHIKNWKSLPAQATNRYVSTSGSTSNNGASASAPWDFATFKKFVNGSDNREADVKALFDGIKIHIAAGNYNSNWKLTPALGIDVTIIGEDKATTFFDGNNSAMLFDFYQAGQTGKMTFKNLTFRNATLSNNSGGAFRISGKNVAFENCDFTNNKAPADGKGGGVFDIWGAATLTANNCTFSGNYGIAAAGVLLAEGSSTSTFVNCIFTGNHSDSAGGVMRLNSTASVSCEGCTFGNSTAAGKNYATQGGVAYVASGCSLSFTNCVFDYNETSANWGSCIYTYTSSNNRLYLNGCVFKNNKGISRGVIGVNSSTGLIYMNNVSFYNNTCSDASNNGWGIAVHCGNSNVCMNNVTSYGNHCGSADKSWYTFNSDGAWLITNCTIVDAPANNCTLLRGNNSATKKSALCNNIFINTNASDKTVLFNTNNSQISAGHNVFSSTSDQQAFTYNESDKTGVTALTAGVYSEPVYSWTNDLTGFTPANQSVVEAVIKAYNESQAGVDDVGTDFYNWLNSIGALGKDARGVSRNGSWWPGAYQN